jgi:hypothetical protein
MRTNLIAGAVFPDLLSLRTPLGPELERNCDSLFLPLFSLLQGTFLIRQCQASGAYRF